MRPSLLPSNPRFQPARPEVLREKLRINPRESWYANVAAVTTNGDYETRWVRKKAGGVSR